MENTSEVTDSFVLATDLKVGMRTSLGPITSIDKITKARVYFTTELASGALFEDYISKDARTFVHG